jgi:GNAT superfamily N-acetyltransferase
VLEEQRLDSQIHDCPGFDCGTKALNDYLARYATQDRRHYIAQVYALVDSSEVARILGYYTLTAAQVDADQVSEKERQQLSRYPIPCIRLGRFAVRQECQGQGLGKRLLGCAVDRCLQARQEVAAYALIVDAKDAEAKSFYAHFGLVAFADRALCMYLALGSCR